MYKVVFNNCYGGFSISLECVKWLHEHGGITEDQYQDYLNQVRYQTRGTGDYWVAVLYRNGKIEDWLERPKKSYSREKFEADINEAIEKGYTCMERTFENVMNNSDIFGRYFMFRFPGSRHDKALVEAVETLGSGICSGGCARLEICEINSRKYKITDYDGRETVHELDEDENIYIIDETY